MLENSTAGLAMVTGEVAVTVTREEHHQNALARYAPAPGGERRVAVELAWCAIGTGKYKGQRAIEVRLDGHRVGELTYAMSQRYAPLVAGVHERGGRPGCEAAVQRDAKGLQVTLRLPRDVHAVPAEEAPTVVVPVVPAVAPVAAQVPESTFTKHRKAWIVAAAVVAVLFFAAIANNDDEPATSSPAADETTMTTTEAPTTTTTTSTTPPPPPPTTTTVVVQPPPPQQTTEQQPAPPPPPVAEEPAPRQGCDPNYTGCVPIASDVDCAGGSGNGPAYADGPVDVIGEDIYDLDDNNDGVACERS